MKGWYLKHPFYIKYMIRESSAVFCTVYALVLLNGLWNLTKGQANYDAWVAGLANPVAVIFHVLALATIGYHAYTWFIVSPKVVPHIYIGTERIPDLYITAAQFAIAAVCYLVLLVAVIWV